MLYLSVVFDFQNLDFRDASSTSASGLLTYPSSEVGLCRNIWEVVRGEVRGTGDSESLTVSVKGERVIMRYVGITSSCIVSHLQ